MDKFSEVRNEFGKIRDKGRKTLSNKEEIKARKILNKSALKPVVNHIRDFISLLHASSKGYKAPVELLTAVVAAILYLLWVFDVIPDFVPVIGYLDDIAVILAVAKMVSVEINKFKKWKVKYESKKDY